MAESEPEKKPEPIQERVIRENNIGIFLVVLGICAVVVLCVFVGFTIGHGTASQTVSETPASSTTVAVTATPTPTPTPTIVAPTVFSFTVLSTTCSNGRYEAETTNGNILFLSNYIEWSELYPSSTYTAQITGYEANGAIDIAAVNLIHAGIASPVYVQPRPVYYSHPDYPVYYHYENQYYQYDGRTTDPVSWKETRGERVVEGRPPNYRR
jgi:hypothetical protein